MFKSVIKHILKFLLGLFKKDYLLEYYQIKRMEGTVMPPITEFYASFIQPGMKIIDVGVNVGTYSNVFLQLGAKVIGLEPQAYCQQIIQKRFQNNPNFLLIPAASGASIGSGEIHKTHSHTIASMNTNWIQTVKKSNRFGGEDWRKTESINITTLDKVITDHFIPDYIKIDVEGFELDVLKGLHHAVDFISFEITLPEMTQTAIDCVNELARIGKYQCVIPNQNLSEIHQWYNQTEILEQLKVLGSGTEKISSDIFCKKIKA